MAASRLDAAELEREGARGRAQVRRGGGRLDSREEPTSVRRPVAWIRARHPGENYREVTRLIARLIERQTTWDGRFSGSQVRRSPAVSGKLPLRLL